MCLFLLSGRLDVWLKDVIVPGHFYYHLNYCHMKLSAEKVRKSLSAYFIKAEGGKNFEETGPLLFFCSKEPGKKEFLFAMEFVQHDGQKIFLTWCPETNEKRIVPVGELDARPLPDIPEEYEKEIYEGEFLFFTIRKRCSGYSFYLDFENNQVFPRSEQEALQKAAAFLLTAENETLWDAVWQEELALTPVWHYNFPAYAVTRSRDLGVENAECLIVGLDCRLDKMSGNVRPFLKEGTYYVEKQKCFVHFDGHDFAFWNTRYLSWKEACKRAEGRFADLDWRFYPDHMRAALVSTEGEALWLLGESKDHSVKILADVCSARILSVPTDIFYQRYRIADADDGRFV